MNMNDTLIKTSLIPKLQEKIKLHHQLYRFPVKAELWEDIFDQCINTETSDWTGGGHGVGADIVVESNHIFSNGSRLQLKSGELNTKNGTLKWNGHRTTKHKSISEKVEFISFNHYDYYVMLSRDKSVWEMGEKIYNLFIFKSDIIDYKSLNWSEKFNKQGKNSGWVGVGDGSFKAEINKSMSDQLWTTCNISLIGNSYEIKI
jgi:hypothetical protein